MLLTFVSSSMKEANPFVHPSEQIKYVTYQFIPKPELNNL